MITSKGIRIFVFLLLIGPSMALAQGTNIDALLKDLRVVSEDGRNLIELKLSEVLQMALERSNLIKQAQFGEKIAASQLMNAQQGNSPVLVNKGELGRSLSTSASTENFTNLIRSEATTLSSEYKKRTRSGIEYSFKFTEIQSSYGVLGIPSPGDAPQEIAGPSDPLHINALSSSVTIPLGQGLGTEVGEIPIRLGEIGVRRSHYLSQRDAMTVLRLVAQVYWKMVELRERKRVQQKGVELSEQLLQDNQDRLRAGVLSPSDVKVSETQLARDRLALFQLNSEILRSEDEARTVLNLENFDYGLLPSDTPGVHQPQESFDVLLERTFSNHPDLGLTRAAVEVNQQQLLSAENKDKTDLSLKFYYTMNGYSNGPFGGTSGFSESDLAGYGASVTWNLPLFDDTSAQNLAMKQFERQQLILQENSVKSQLSVQLQSLIRSLRLAKNEVETAQTAVRLAEDLLQNELQRLRLGRSTSYRVAQAQQDAALAKRQEIVSRVAAERTFLEFLILTNGLHQHYGLNLPSIIQTNPGQ